MNERVAPLTLCRQAAAELREKAARLEADATDLRALADALDGGADAALATAEGPDRPQGVAADPDLISFAEAQKRLDRPTYGATWQVATRYGLKVRRAGKLYVSEERLRDYLRMRD